MLKYDGSENVDNPNPNLKLLNLAVILARQMGHRILLKTSWVAVSVSKITTTHNSTIKSKQHNLPTSICI